MSLGLRARAVARSSSTRYSNCFTIRKDVWAFFMRKELSKFLESRFARALLFERALIMQHMENVYFLRKPAKMCFLLRALF